MSMTFRKTWGSCFRIPPQVGRVPCSLCLTCGDVPLAAHEGPGPPLPCYSSSTSQFHQLRVSLWFSFPKSNPKIVIVQLIEHHLPSLSGVRFTFTPRN